MKNKVKESVKRIELSKKVSKELNVNCSELKNVICHRKNLKSTLLKNLSNN